MRVRCGLAFQCRAAGTRLLAPALILSLLLGCFGVAAQKPRGPFSEGEIVGLLKGYVRPARVASLAHEYGISFQLTPQIQAELRNAGATDELLKTLQQLAPRVSQPPHLPATGSILITTTGGAEVYVDDRLEGKTDAQGQLSVPKLMPGQHNVRVAAAGYSNYEGRIGVTAGGTTASSITLAPIAPPPGAAHFRVSHHHLVGASTGELTIGGGHIQFHADKGSDSFSFPLTSITQYGTVRLGADFFFQVKTGKSYFFNGPATDVLRAIAQAKEQP
jgi:hypothetical protein